MFTGSADRTVLPAVGAKIAPFYALAGLPSAAIHVEATVPAGHGFATENGPVACGDTAPPFVNKCDLDQAREILDFVHGPLQPAAATTQAPMAFDQTRYLKSPEPRGMAETGWVYIPSACRAGEPCRVHIVFHGCLQNAEAVGDAVTVGTGYNRWGRVQPCRRTLSADPRELEQPQRLLGLVGLYVAPSMPPSAASRWRPCTACSWRSPDRPTRAKVRPAPVTSRGT